MIFRSRQLDEKTNIRCYQIVTDENKSRYGQECGHRLAKKNSKGEIAGQFVCRHCKILYEAVDNKLNMIGKWNKEKRTFDYFDK